MQNILPKLKTVFIILLTLVVIGLGAGLYFLYANQKVLSSSVESLDGTPAVVFEGSEEQSTSVDICGDTCKAEIARLVSQAVATLSGATTQTVVERQTVVTTESSGGTDFVPMGSTHTTTSMDWANIEDTAVYIDVVNDYGEDADVSLEASLKVAHGNGKAYVRLYDDTNKIAVDGSELSTTDNVTFIRVATGNLPLWRGRNLYKIQIKSLNSFEITYSGGKIRINY